MESFAKVVWQQIFFFTKLSLLACYVSMITTTKYARVASVENFDLPLMAFGPKLVKLELTNCTNFQSGTALNIRK